MTRTMYLADDTCSLILRRSKSFAAFFTRSLPSPSDGLEPSASDGEGRERVKKAANDLDLRNQARQMKE